MNMLDSVSIRWFQDPVLLNLNVTTLTIGYYICEKWAREATARGGQCGNHVAFKANVLGDKEPKVKK